MKNPTQTNTKLAQKSETPINPKENNIFKAGTQLEPAQSESSPRLLLPKVALLKQILSSTNPHFSKPNLRCPTASPAARPAPDQAVRAFGARRPAAALRAAAVADDPSLARGLEEGTAEEEGVCVGVGGEKGMKNQKNIVFFAGFY